MAELSVTWIDVGWGDSILVRSVDEAGTQHLGLVDCNDYETERTALVYVKRFLEREGIDHRASKPNFEWILLTHGHADHARGIRRMIETFGTKHFWYPKSVPSTTYGTLLDYANRSSNVLHHQAVDSGKAPDPSVGFGSVSMQFIWPDPDQIDESNENNNSVVLALTLDEVTVVLSGDAEAENWPQILPRLPETVDVFHVPHHGGRNGLFDPKDATPWLDHFLHARTVLALSSHIRPHGHPHPDVVKAIEASHLQAFRTDTGSHLTFTTDGTRPASVRYSHVMVPA
jgi:beta-lactamase superfamily II metal-dependent hydrolase